MRKVAIVSDGTADIPKDLIEKYNIHIIPIFVVFETEKFSIYGDYGDISKEEFYERLRTCDELPTTGIASQSYFISAFEAAAKEAKSVIGIFVSEKLSAHFVEAKRIAATLEDIDITVVDARAAAIPLGLTALEAAIMAHEGKSKEEILTRLEEELIPQNKMVVVLDTLQNLYRSGRIGKIQKFFGQSLKIKPIICYNKDGSVGSRGKIRGDREEVIKRFKFLAPFVVKHAITDNIFIWHSEYKEPAKELLEIMEQHNDKGKKIRIVNAGPVVGTHIGEKTIGIVYIGPYNENWMNMKEA
ncbi:MAG: DegV family protein [Asgard group archaeon]|nr:DegV family protein [Asgard group archaeon]